VQPQLGVRLHSVPNPLAGSTARSNRGSC
jgi:hypothetical protein